MDRRYCNDIKYSYEGTEGGEILYVENFEFRAVIYPVTTEQYEELTPIYALAPTSRGGFVSGLLCAWRESRVAEMTISYANNWLGHAEGELKVFGRSEDTKEQYSLETYYNIPDKRVRLSHRSYHKTHSLIHCFLKGIISTFANGPDDNIVLATNRQELLHFTLSNLNQAKENRVKKEAASE
jgi:hypothetical protein